LLFVQYCGTKRTDFDPTLESLTFYIKNVHSTKEYSKKKLPFKQVLLAFLVQAKVTINSTAKSKIVTRTNTFQGTEKNASKLQLEMRQTFLNQPNLHQ
jgi:hypothetical protein